MKQYVLIALAAFEMETAQPLVRALANDAQNELQVLVLDECEVPGTDFACAYTRVTELGIPNYRSKAFAWGLEELRQYVLVYSALQLLEQGDGPILLARAEAPPTILAQGAPAPNGLIQVACESGEQSPSMTLSVPDAMASTLAVYLAAGSGTGRLVRWSLERMELYFDSGRTDTFFREWPQYAHLFGVQSQVRLLRCDALPNAAGDYGWDFLEDGTPLPPMLRTYFARNYRLRITCGDNPFAQTERLTAKSVVPGDLPSEPPLTPVADCIWRRRADLKKAFAQPRAGDRRGYLRWFLQYAAEEYGLDEAYILPVRTALDRTVKAAPAAKKNLFGKGKPAGPQYPQGVNLCGHIRGEYGIGEATRMLAASLDAADIPLSLVDIASERDYRYTNMTWAPRITNEFQYATNILYTNADGLDPFLQEISPSALVGRTNIGYWSWELPQFPDGWKPAFNHLDEVWTISEFAAGALRSATDKPVFVLPHAVEPVAPDVDLRRASFGLPQDECLFLAMYDVRSQTERKNPKAAVDAFLKAFGTGAKGAGLVLKVSAPEGWCATDEWLKSLRRLPNVYIVDSFLDRPQLNALISLCDAHISLHRAEGFGFGPAEAMYFGKPAILTNWSGNTEYMRDGACCPVNYTLIELDRNYGPYQMGWQWAQPDVDEAAAYMRRLYEDTEYRARIGAAGRRVILEEFSAGAIGQRALAQLRKMGQM